MPRRAGVICRVENRVFNSSGNWEVKGKAFKIVYLNDLSKRLSGEKWIDHSAAGLSSPGVPGVPWHPQILADQLTLSLPDGTDYFHQILVLAPPDLRTALSYIPYCTFRLRKSEKLEKIAKSLWKRFHEVFDLNLMTIIRINE